jgi:hypothetical protein
MDLEYTHVEERVYPWSQSGVIPYAIVVHAGTAWHQMPLRIKKPNTPATNAGTTGAPKAKKAIEKPAVNPIMCSHSFK